MHEKVVKKVKVILFLLFLSTVICGIIWIYYKAETGKYYYLKKSYYISREIDTPNKLWLDGYLGVFFRTKNFGLLNWLMIPIIVYFLFTFERRERWQKAVFFVYILSAILFGLKGFVNYRYAFTLFPFTVTAVLLFIWDITERYSIIYKFIAIIILIGLVGYSFNNNLDLYKAYWSSIMQRQTRNSLENTITYINKLDLNENNNILVMNIMDFYYFTEKKAIEIGYKRNLKQKKYYDYLRKNKVAYILIDTRALSSFYVNLRDVLIYGAKTLATDDCYVLYELIPWTSNKNRKPVYQGDFTKWNGPRRIKNISREFNNIIPHLIVIGVRGEYEIFNSGKDIIRISLLKSHDIDENVFAIGYDLGPNGLNLDVKPNDVVVFEINACKSSFSSANIFIQDFDGKWWRDSKIIKRNSCHSYSIAKLIRANSSKIILGIDYSSKLKDAFIEIQNPKIYIKRREY